MSVGLRYDVSPIGLGKNWVTDVGGLPLFARAIAHALIRAGHSESDAIQLAIGAIQRWARGEGNGYSHGKVTAKTQAKAAAALAEWEAKKAAAHAKSGGKGDRAGFVGEAAAAGPGASFAGLSAPDSTGAGLLLPLGPVVKPKPREAKGIGPHRFRPDPADARRCRRCGKGPLVKAHRAQRSSDAGPDPAGIDANIEKIRLGHTLGQMAAANAAPKTASAETERAEAAVVRRESVAQIEALLGRPVEARHAGPGHVHVPTGHANTPPRKRLAAKATHREALAAYEPLFAQPMKALFAQQQTSALVRLNGNRGKAMIRRALAALEARDATAPQPGPATGEPAAGSSAGPVVDPAALYDTAYWLGKTVQALGPGYDHVAADATAKVRAQLDTDTAAGAAADPMHPAATAISDEMHSQSNAAVKAALANRAQTVAASISQTTYEALADTLGEGMAQGESIPQLADRVKAVFAEATDTRATLIARTEANSAANIAQNQYAENLPSGIVAGKEWLAIEDMRTRKNHKLADGQKQRIGVPFDVGGYPMMHPGADDAPPSEVCNCRCTTAFIPWSQRDRLLQQPVKDFNPNPATGLTQPAS